MTLIAAWTNKQDHPTSLMLGTDSRLSSPGHHWDRATKIIRLYPTHYYLAYCGDALGTLCAIQQTAVLFATSHVLLKDPSTSSPCALATCASIISKHLESNMRAFPVSWGGTGSIFCFGYCRRLSLFELHEISLPIASNPPPPTTYLFQDQRFHAFGSGARDFKSRANATGSSADLAKTFNQVVSSGAVPTVGGPPQFVSIGIGRSRLIGINWPNPAGGAALSTVLGQELNSRNSLDHVDFRDMDFCRDQYLRSGKVSVNGKPLSAKKGKDGITRLSEDKRRSARRRRSSTGRKY